MNKVLPYPYFTLYDAYNFTACKTQTLEKTYEIVLQEK